MALTRYTYRNPTLSGWPEFSSNRLSRLFDDSLFTPPSGSGWSPAVSVHESPTELTLTADLPGMAEEDIQIEVEDGVLTLRGEKSEIREEDGEDLTWHVRERRFGSFTRTFKLPRRVDSAKISAAYANGVVSITMPKAEAAKSRTIEIGS